MQEDHAVVDVFLQRHVAHDAHGAETFRRQERDVAHCLGSVDPRDRVQRQIGGAAVGDDLGMVQRPGRLPDHGARKLELDRTVGELGADRLVLDDVASALAADLRIGDRSFVRGAANAEIDRRHQRHGARRLRAARERALSLLAEQMVGRHPAILERDARARAVEPARHRPAVGVGTAEGPDLRVHGQSRRIARHQQRAHAVHAGFLWVGARLYREQLGDRRIGNERDRTVDHPVAVALLDRHRFPATLGGERTVIGPADIGVGVAPGEGKVIFVILYERLEEARVLR